MKTVLVALTQAFIRHPAGLVFELEAATGISGWDDDTRLRERQSFLDKRVYQLPDGGNGLPCELPLAMTALCPPEIFESADLRSGPCRITGASRVSGQSTEPVSNLKYGIGLAEINGINAQGLQLPLQNLAGGAKTLRLRDRMRKHEVWARDWQAFPDGLIDCSALLPGFYELDIEITDVFLYQIQFIKSFPLLVEVAPNGQFSTQKTIY